MRIPTIEGTIKRRILVNYHADPNVVSRLLPGGFRPKLQAGRALVGICLIRLEHIRPKAFPKFAGISSENAAHRVAVEWDDAEGQRREGVYVVRRDTNSRWNHWLGGRLFPGVHHPASFQVAETADGVEVQVSSRDQGVAIGVGGTIGEQLPATSVFGSLSEASRFFEAGSLGYSPTRDPRRLEGLLLCTHGWRVRPLQVRHVFSSYFADASLFPTGSVEFDHALLMSDLPHEWHGAPDLRV